MAVKKALLVFFNGRSNAGGAERMVGYLEDYLKSRGLTTEIIDEKKLRRSWLGRIYWHLFRWRHFEKRRLIYMARFASVYAWWRLRPQQFWVSNGEATPFFPVDLVVSQGCYHIMEKAYGRKEEHLSRIAKLQMRGLSKAKKIIAVTVQVKRNLIKHYSISPQKIEIVANRVDTRFFQPLPRHTSQIKTVLYAGRLEEGKGLTVLLKLAAEIEQSNDWRFLIACNNDFNTVKFSAYTKTTITVGLGLANINEFAYGQCDVVIFPSKFESFGMITIESLSAGVPVLSTPVGIVPDLLQRHYPGVYQLDECDGRELVDQLNYIVSDFAKVDRNKLHESIEQEFGIPSYRCRLDEVLGHQLNLESHA